MKKALIAVFVLLLGFSLAYYFIGGASYAKVTMSRGEYKQIKETKKDISVLLDDLENFNYKKASTMDKIEKDAKKIINLNTNQLSAEDLKKLKNDFYQADFGIVAITKKAQQAKYNLDLSIASQFHDRINSIIELSAANIKQSSAQRQKITEQMQKDLKIDERLYEIGARHEH